MKDVGESCNITENFNHISQPDAMWLDVWIIRSSQSHAGGFIFLISLWNRLELPVLYANSFWSNKQQGCRKSIFVSFYKWRRGPTAAIWKKLSYLLNPLLGCRFVSSLCPAPNRDGMKRCNIPQCSGIQTDSLSDALLSFLVIKQTSARGL
jgi:hypothetical protein